MRQTQRHGPGPGPLGRAGGGQPRQRSVPRPSGLGLCGAGPPALPDPLPVQPGPEPPGGGGRRLAAAGAGTAQLPHPVSEMGHEPGPGRRLQPGPARRPPGRGLSPLCAGPVRAAAPGDRDLPRPAAGKLRRRRRPLRLRHALLQPPDLVQRQHRRPGPADHPVRHQPVLPRLRRGGPLLGGAQPLQRPPLHHRGADGGGPLGHLRL